VHGLAWPPRCTIEAAGVVEGPRRVRLTDLLGTTTHGDGDVICTGTYFMGDSPYTSANGIHAKQGATK
jgi:hypothetical protein